MGTLIASRWGNWIKLVMFISLSTQIYPDLPWCIWGVWSHEGARVDDGQKWQNATKLHPQQFECEVCHEAWQAALEHVAQGFECEVCHEAWEGAVEHVAQGFECEVCHEAWEGAVEHVDQGFECEVCHEAWEGAVEHVAQGFECEVCHEAWEAARPHADRTWAEDQGFALAAANADDGVIESSPSMKLAVQCIILHLERDKVVARGEQKDFLVFILGTTQPLSHGHLIWSLHLAELILNEFNET